MKFPDVGGGRGKQGNGQGNVFVKLEDGTKLRGVFRGDPYRFRQHWIEKRSYVCLGKDACEYCKAGDKSKFRFRINFLVQEEGVWLAKILEQGISVYEELKELHENDYNLESTLVTVSRSGTGTDTSYKVLPAAKNLLPQDFKKLAAIPLNELAHKPVEPVAAQDDADANEDVPF